MKLRIRELRVMTMWHRLLNNIDYNFNQLLIGLSIVSMGLFLWLEKMYFSWPPELRPMMNSEYADLFFIFLGLMLLFFAATNKDIRVSKKWTVKDITLTVAGGATILLLIEQLWQVLFAKNMDMVIAVIFDIFLFILIIRCAYDS